MYPPSKSVSFWLQNSYDLHKAGQFPWYMSMILIDFQQENCSGMDEESLGPTRVSVSSMMLVSRPKRKRIGEASLWVTATNSLKGNGLILEYCYTTIWNRICKFPYGCSCLVWVDLILLFIIISIAIVAK